jgi:Common central domain of tyrosinase
MKIDRRKAMQLLAAAAATVPFADSLHAQTSQRKRLSITTFSKDADLVAAMRRGVSAMKALPPGDPSSWWWHGAVHHLDINRVPDFPRNATMPSPAEIKRYWRQCPHGINSFTPDEFLGWHSAYLIHFENALIARSGLNGWALPFWNYENPNERKLPEIFRVANIKVDDQWKESAAGTLKSNPLFEPLRRRDLADGRGTLADSAVDISGFSKLNDFRGIAGADSVGGSVSGMGALDALPHGQVHVAIGRNGRPDGSPGLMGSIPTAAFDPIFWVHHANIDRLWRQWLCVSGRKWGRFGDQAELNAWLAAKIWPFKAADGVEVLKSRGDYMLPGGLAYSYEDVSTACPPPALTTVGGVIKSGPLAIDSTIKGFSTVARVGQASGGISIRGGDPRSVTIKTLPIVGAGTSKSAKSVLTASVPARPRRLVLDIARATFSGRDAIGYDVHVNPKPGDTLTRLSKSFVGVVNGFALQTSETGDHVHDGHGDVVQSFDISEKTGSTSLQSVTVTLVPFALVVPPPPDFSASDAALDLGKVELRIVEGTSNPVM